MPLTEERPASVLFAQYALIAQACFDVVAGAGFGAYYGWAMSLAAQVSGQSMWVPVASGVLPTLMGVAIAMATAGAAWALSTRHATAWIGGLAVCALHLVLNPCCAPLPALIIALFLREDLRDWLE
ncbi:MAG: hypothetical protein EP330_27735 [Deltaproteobacteria bacterium]|nr:MAG: hypothetical protein EP330_27735 [Deltaproteobacteria bacterium]